MTLQQCKDKVAANHGMLSCLEVQEKIESLLPKEKHQIIEAASTGFDITGLKISGEQYFKEVYEKQTITINKYKDVSFSDDVKIDTINEKD